MPFLSAFLGLFAQDPTVRMMQMLLLLLATVDVFFVFFTTRDILLRTRSFFYQFFSIVLVAGLPGLGFLIYLLIRPARTIRQRETDLLVREMALVLRELGQEDDEEDIEEIDEPEVAEDLGEELSNEEVDDQEQVPPPSAAA